MHTTHLFLFLIGVVVPLQQRLSAINDKYLIAMDYDDQLDRALEQTPDYDGDSTRFQLPDVSARREGNETLFENIVEVANQLNRDVDHIITFLQNEFGTGAERDGDRARFVGSFGEDRFQRHIEEYADTYVLCSQCGKPDTRLETQQGETVVRCTACGAFSST